MQHIIQEFGNYQEKDNFLSIQQNITKLLFLVVQAFC